MKVSELSGELLDAWVAKAEGLGGKVQHGYPNFEITPYSPSVFWSHGGPIIEREDIWLSQENGLWSASCYPHVEVQEATTLLVAAMRAFLASVYGLTVDDSQAD